MAARSSVEDLTLAETSLLKIRGICRALNVRAASSALNVSVVSASMFCWAAAEVHLRPSALSFRKYEVHFKPNQRVSSWKTLRSMHKSS